MPIEDYGDFLDKILEEQGLAHGYDIDYDYGFEIAHRVYVKDSERKAAPFSWSRIISKNLIEVRDVARFTSEPSFQDDSSKVGIVLVDSAYAPQMDVVLEKIIKYSEIRRNKNPVVLVRQNKDVILRVL